MVRQFLPECKKNIWSKNVSRAEQSKALIIFFFEQKKHRLKEKGFCEKKLQ